MKLEGYKGLQVGLAELEMSHNSDLTRPEATALAAMEALNIIGIRAESEGRVTGELEEEIARRTELIKESPAWQSALEKVTN